MNNGTKKEQSQGLMTRIWAWLWPEPLPEEAPARGPAFDAPERAMVGTVPSVSAAPEIATDLPAPAAAIAVADKPPVPPKEAVAPVGAGPITDVPLQLVPLPAATSHANPPTAQVEVTPAAASTPAAPPGEAPKAPDQDKAINDIMSLFTEDMSLNEGLDRLAAGLDEVSMEDLISDCRQVAALLDSRRRRPVA